MSVLDDALDFLRDAVSPTTWRVGEHEARKRRAAVGSEDDRSGYECVLCGAEADTREELAEMECWEVVE